jgi:hypothetical protein
MRVGQVGVWQDLRVEGLAVVKVLALESLAVDMLGFRTVSLAKSGLF